jgi:hypothetical protein
LTGKKNPKDGKNGAAAQSKTKTDRGITDKQTEKKDSITASEMATRPVTAAGDIYPAPST